MSLSIIDTRYRLALVWATVAFFAVMPPLIWLQTTEGITQYLHYSLPPGQFAYVISRLMGLYGVSLLSMQILLGLSLPLTRRPRLHAVVGGLALSVIVLHMALFVYAASVRSGHFAGHLLLPQLWQGYYNLGVSLGVIGMWVLLLVVLAGVLRLSGHSHWRWIHYLAVPAFLSIYTHGLLIGTDTRFIVGKVFYGVIALMIMTAIYLRVKGSRIR